MDPENTKDQVEEHLKAGSEINFLAHLPRGMVDEKIHQPSIFFAGQITYTLISVHLIDMVFLMNKCT